MGNSFPTHTHTYTHNRPFVWDYQVGWYQKKHSPTHTHPSLQSCVIAVKLTLQFSSVCTRAAFAGGVREAFFSTEYYKLVWGKRIGFAKVATEAHVVSYMFYLYSNGSMNIEHIKLAT